jgi:hypothetical protein
MQLLTNGKSSHRHNYFPHGIGQCLFWLKTTAKVIFSLVYQSLSFHYESTYELPLVLLFLPNVLNVVSSSTNGKQVILGLIRLSFHILMLVSSHSVLLCVVTPCGPVCACQRSGRTLPFPSSPPPHVSSKTLVPIYQNTWHHNSEYQKV